MAAVATAARQLGLPGLLGHDCRERTVALGLVVAPVRRPDELLSTTRWWGDTTLSGDLGLTEVAADEVSAARGWLARRQYRIERRLADKHLVWGRPAYLRLEVSGVHRTGGRRRAYPIHATLALLILEQGAPQDPWAVIRVAKRVRSRGRSRQNRFVAPTTSQGPTAPLLFGCLATSKHTKRSCP